MKGFKSWQDQRLDVFRPECLTACFNAPSWFSCQMQTLPIYLVRYLLHFSFDFPRRPFLTLHFLGDWLAKHVISRMPAKLETTFGAGHRPISYFYLVQCWSQTSRTRD